MDRNKISIQQSWRATFV